MKQFFVFLAGMLLFMQTSYSQTPFSQVENFDGDSLVLSLTPSSAWRVNTKYSVSPPNSYRGYVPNVMGDSIVLQTQPYDFTGIEFVVMRFQHICKISPRDGVRMEYKIPSQVWMPVPVSAYKGTSSNYRSNGVFNAASYMDWDANDSLAIPQPTWWKEEVFDLSNVVSWENGVEFRFILKRGNTQGTQIAYGWLIDDYEIAAAPYLISFPIVEFVYPFVRDTVYGTGPWTVNAKVKTTTAARIETPFLKWDTNGVFVDSIPMTMVAGDSLWRATIPQYIAGTKVNYSVMGIDTTNNEKTINSWYYIKQGCGGSVVGTATIRNGSSSQTVIPLNQANSYSYTQQLYLASEIKQGGVIGSFAFDVSTVASAPQIVDIYMGHTLQTTIAAAANTIPYSALTLVYSGIHNFAAIGWSVIPLQVPFSYNGVDNIVVAVHKKTGASFTGGWFCETNSASSAIRYFGGTASEVDPAIGLPTATSIVGTIRPNIEFYFTAGGGCEDTNSVSLLSIDMSDTVLVSPNDSFPIIATIKNKGIADLDSVTISYTINGQHIKDTTVTFNPALPWDFNKQITLGYYIPEASKISEITVWTSNPNGVPDSIALNDTLTKMIYGFCDISAEFTKKPADTVYFTGSHDIAVRISTRSGATIDTVWLYVENTLNSVTEYDTLAMLPSGVNLYTTAIPKHLLYSHVAYSIILIDSLHNIVELRGSYFIEKGCGAGGRIEPDYFYTGSVQPITLPRGTYEIECWGADGGGEAFSITGTVHGDGGKGGYSKGEYTVGAPTSLYIYVGGKGISAICTGANALDGVGGWNGGGSGKSGSGTVHYVGGGGGGTDIRTSQNATYMDRILVAGGGGGAGSSATGTYTGEGGNGGGNSGQDGVLGSAQTGHNGKGGSQSRGGFGGVYGTTSIGDDGIFGVGGNGGASGNAFPAGGGGGGWYGGGGGSTQGGSGGGGSGYIGGTGIINAITAQLTEPGFVANPDTSGNGFVRITAIGGSSNSGSESCDDTNAVAILSIDVNGMIPTSPLLATPVVVTIANTGIADLHYATLSYSVNGIYIDDTLVQFVPALPWDYETQITLGDYIFNVNQFDTLTVWASLPNGYVDTVCDTLTKLIYGTSDIFMEFVQEVDDTVYTTGPHAFSARVYSISGKVISTVPVYAEHTLLSVTTIDTFFMQPQGGDIWTCEIANIPLGSDVVYTIRMTDFVGNIAELSGDYYVSDDISPIKDSLIVGLRTSNGMANCLFPFTTNSDESRTRTLYLASELGNTTHEVTLHGLAYENPRYNFEHLRDQKCYLLAVPSTTTSISLSLTINPVSAGATLVYADTHTTNIGWNYFMFNKPFTLSAGMNLVVYWMDEGSCDVSANRIYWSYSDIGETTKAESYASKWDCSTSILPDRRVMSDSTRPITLFYFGDMPAPNNSVAMNSFFSPKSEVVAGVSTPVIVRIENKGRNPLTYCEINWSVNGNQQPPMPYYYNNPAGLASDFTDTVTLGSYIPSSSKMDEIVAWVSMPNNVIDSMAYDDLLRIYTWGGCGLPLSGNITIGKTGRDFPTINEALEAMTTCGIGGNITLLLDDGVYKENINLTNSNAITQNYTVTLRSASGNRDNVIIRPDANAAFVLNNSDNLIIEGITVDVNTLVVPAIQFMGACTNVVVRDCKLLGNKTTTTSNTANAPISKATATGMVDSIFFINNYIEGGYYGFYFYGGTGTAAYGTNVVFDSNTLINQYYYAAYPYYTDFTSCNYNTVLSRTGTSNIATYWYGFRFYYCNGPVVGNKIHQRADTILVYPYGIYAYYHNYYNQGTSRGLIANNEIILNTPNAYYGMYCGYNNVDIYHNSIYMYGTGNAYGIYLSTSSNMTIENNNIVMAGGATSYPIYHSSGTFTSAYNNLYAQTNIGYSGGARTDLAAWRAVTSDSTSIRVQPQWVNNPRTNLKVSNYLDMFCNGIPAVNTDIDGEPRVAVTTMGCYEGIPTATTNIMLAKLLNFREGTIAGQQDTLKVVVMNTGTTPISSINLEWSENNIPQLPGGNNFPTSKTLQWGDFDTIAIGVITYQFGNVEVKAWLNSLNGGMAIDEVSKDDTIKVSGFICSVNLSGIVTVGQGKDYPTLEAALDMGYLCGVGNVTIVLDSGNYPMSVDLTDIADLLGNYTLTLTSSTGRAEDVVIRPASGVAFIMNNTNNIVLKHITIDARTGTYGIQFTGDAENITIDSCILLANPTGTATTAACIYKTINTGNLNGLTVKNSVLTGGYYGIYLNGAAALKYKNVTIDNNTITTQYYYGIYHNYVDSSIISSNYFTPRVTNQGTTWTCIYSYYDIGGRIIGNSIYANNANITTQVRGMQVYYADSTTIVANNEINLNSNATTTDGIYAYYVRKLNIYHNTIRVIKSGTTGTNRAIYAYVSAANERLTVKNNIFIAEGGAVATIYAFYLGGTAANNVPGINIIADYNNYYSTGTNLGYAVAAARVDLTAWKTALSPQDSNAVNKMPIFKDYPNSLELAEYSSLYCDTLPDVPADIIGYPRIMPTTMGCYAEQLLNANIALTTIVGLRDAHVNGQTDTLKVIVMNTGLSPINSINLGWTINDTVQTSVTRNYSVPLARLGMDTITLGTITYFPGNITVSAYLNDLDQGTLIDEYSSDDTTSASVYVCAGAFSGIISIGNTGQFATVAEAMNALLTCGVGGDVIFELENGTYAANLNFANLANYMGNYSLTIRSRSGNANNVIFQPASGVTVTLNSSNNLTLENLTFNGRTTGAHCVQFTGACTNLVIRNCNLLSDTVGTASTISHPLYKASSTGVIDNFRMVGCLLDGGYYCAYFYGGTANSIGSLATNIVWDSNTFRNGYLYQAYPCYTHFTSISHNTFLSRSDNTSSYVYLLNFSTGCHVDDIIGNRLRARVSQGTEVLYFHAIYMSSVNTTTAIPGKRPTVIANNEIVGSVRSTTVANGIYLSSTGKATDPPIYIVNNSVYFAGVGAARGVNFATVPAGQLNVVKNNMLYVTGSNGASPAPAHPIYLGTAFSTTLYDIDANNYYASGAPNYIGYAGGNRDNFPDWRLVVSTDKSSIRQNPSFTNTAVSLALNNYTPFLCERNPYAPTNILGVARGISTAMGAYGDAIILARNASLTEFLGITPDAVLGNKDTLRAVFSNNGTTPIDSVDIEWSVEGVSYGSQTVYYAPPLLMGESDTILLGEHTYTATGTTNLKAWINQANDWTAGDDFRPDDTIRTSLYVCGSLTAGTYIISDTSTYKTITQFLNILSTCSPVGNITLLMDSGRYVENVNFTNMGNYFKDYSLTIASRTGKAGDVVIQPTSGVVVTLNNMRNLTLENITFNGRATTTATYCVQFTGACTNIVMRNCNLLCDTVATGTTVAPLYKASSTGIVDSFRMVGCFLEGGYYGAYFYGGSANALGSLNTNIVWDSNTFKSNYLYGMSAYYTYFTSISHNTFLSRVSNNTTYWYGLQTTTGCHVEDIIGNRIMQRNTQTTAMNYAYGIYLGSANITTVIPGKRPTMITNNEIIANCLTTSITYGIYLLSSGKATDPPIYILNNSVHISGTGPGRGLHTSVGAGQKTVVKNNLLYTTGSAATPSFPFYLGTAFDTNIYDIEYNNYYAAGAPNLIGYAGANRIDLADWQSVVTIDTVSVSVSPLFRNPAVDLSLLDDSGLECPAHPNATTDILDVSRDSITTMGCYQMVPLNGNIRLAEILTGGAMVNGQTDSIMVVIRNTGLTPITSINLEWSLDDTVQTAGGAVFATSLNRGESDTITLGTITYTSGSHEIVVWMNELNQGSLIDELYLDDTVKRLIYVCATPLVGRFVVDSSGTGDFESLEEAFFALSACMGGNITLALAPGVYDYNINLSNNRTWMYNFSLTIESTDNDADSVVIRPTENAAILLSNTNNFILKDVTVDVSTLTVPAIQFLGPCTNILVRDCKLLGNPTTTTSNAANAPVSKASGTGIVDNISFINNLINGGYYGWYFYGGTGVTAYGTNVVFDSNTVSNQYYYATYPYYVDFTSCSHNTILSRTANTSTYWYALRMYYANGPAIGNRIIQRSTAITYPYGIYSYEHNSRNQGSSRGLIANNEIILYTTSNTYPGIYCAYNNVDIFHNSIYISGTGNTYGINLTTSSNTRIENNNIVMACGATAYPIYHTSGIFTSSYNNLYAQTNVGYTGSSPITSPSAWYSAVPSDSTSVSTSPNFIDVNKSLELSNYTGLICLLLPEVPKNILDETRTVFTTMGAYGIGVEEIVDMELTSISLESENVSFLCLADYIPLKVSVANKGIETFNFATDSLVFDINVTGPAESIPFDTVIVVNTGYLGILETQEFRLMDSLDISYSGTYNVTVSITHAKDTISDNDTVRAVYHNTRIPLPLNEEFDMGIQDEIFAMNGNTMHLWTPVLQGLGKDTVLVPDFGSQMIAFGGSRGAMVTLSTKQIQLSKTRLPKVEFWYYHDTIESDDYMDVRITIDGTLSYTPLLSLTKQSDSLGWKHYEISLIPYMNGTCISLLFESMTRSEDVNDGYQYIDRIQIISQQDLAISDLNITGLHDCTFDKNELKIKRTTTTNQIIDFALPQYATSIHVDITGPVNYSYDYPLTDVLVGDTFDIITIAKDINLVPGKYTIKAYLTDPIDEDNSNDTVSVIFDIDPSINIKATPVTRALEFLYCIEIGSKVYQEIEITNTGNIDFTNIPVMLEVVGKVGTYYTLYDTLEALPVDSMKPLHFTDEYLVPAENLYNVVATAGLGCISISDSRDIIMECVNMNDIELLALVTPSSICDTMGSAVNLEVQIANNSQFDLFPLVKINALITANGITPISMTGNITNFQPADTTIYRFSSSYTVPNVADYTITVFIDRVDIYPYNDTIVSHRCTNLGLTKNNMNDFALEQNIPNPAEDITLIAYNLPEDGQVVFTVYTITGQTLHIEKQDAYSGKNELKFNTLNLANGIYYYSMEYKGERLVKKMTIQK